MSFSRYPLEEIRGRCDIVDIVSRYVALKRTGKNLKGLCPFHSEKTPSFVVNQDTQRWMCFGCGENGDVFSFLMRVEGLTFPEAVEQLAEKTGVQIAHKAGFERSNDERSVVLRINQLAADFFRKTLYSSQEALEYFKRRGVSAESIEKFQIGYAPSEWQGLADFLRSKRVDLADAAKTGVIVPRERGTGYYDRFRNRVMFPIQDSRDRIIAFGGRAIGDGDEVKYINSPETSVFAKNKTLYALNFARKSISEGNPAILVEGYFDAIAAHAAGFTNVVATLGTALTSEHVNLLSRYTKTVALAFDADSAGMTAAIRSAPMFEESEFDVRIAAMPDGEDPDSLIHRGDRAVFAELIQGAKPIPDFKLEAIAAKHDVTSREGQLAMLKEAVPVIASAARQVDRERLIALIAPYHPNYRSGVTPAEVHIRQEVNGFRSRQARQKTRSAPAHAEKVDLLAQETRAVREAERGLLSIAIHSSSGVQDVFSSILPKEFYSEDAKLIAGVLQEEFGEMGRLDIEELSARLTGAPGESLLNELLVAEEPLEWPMADLVETIRTYNKREREKRFRALADKIQKGEIKRTDGEFAEYWQLLRDLAV